MGCSLYELLWQDDALWGRIVARPSCSSSAAIFSRAIRIAASLDVGDRNIVCAGNYTSNCSGGTGKHTNRTWLMKGNCPLD